MKFVVKLPGGENHLVEVSPAATAAAIRAAAGFGGQGHGLVMNSSPVADSAPASSFPELSTFYVVARSHAPVATEAAAECTICLEPLGDNAPTAPVQALQCGHFFHSVCIREWCHHSSYCPLCRRVITLGSTPAPAPKVGPPSAEDVVVILVATREALVRSPEWRLVVSAVRSIDAWRKSPAGQATIATASAVTSAAVTLASRVAGQAAMSLGSALTDALVGRAPPPPQPSVTIVSVPAPSAGAPVTVTRVLPTRVVTCPSCRRVLQTPPGAPAFRCPCGCTLSA